VEAACHVLAARAGADTSLSAVEVRYPFDPHRLRASAFAKGSVHVKGAPDTVLPRCRNPGGAEAALAALTERGLRVLAVARRDLTAPPERADDAERDLTLLGLVGLEDPPRPDAREAVARCRRAGVRTALVTGDDPRTARAVARSVGLAAADAPVLTGAELPDDLRGIGELLDRDGAVVARASPEDPPRDTADLVLLDGGLAAAATAVELGRGARANLRRVLTYCLTGAVGTAAPFLAWALSGGAVPPALSLLQVLALTVGVDLVPVLALG